MCKIDLSNSGFLGFGIDEDKANKLAAEVVSLMARNYELIEELQGHQTDHFKPIQVTKGENKKVGDFVRLRLTPFMRTEATSRA